MNLTDNEIIKALEEWRKELVSDYQRLKLLDAPMDCFEESHGDTITNLTNALDLINRLQAEIESLKEHNAEYKFCNLLGNVLVYSKNLKDYNDMRNGLISYGMKKFAERLKAETKGLLGANFVDDLVKEMESKG